MSKLFATLTFFLSLSLCLTALNPVAFAQPTVTPPAPANDVEPLSQPLTTTSLLDKDKEDEANKTLFENEFEFRSLAHVLTSGGLVAGMMTLGLLVPDSELGKTLMSSYGIIAGILAYIPAQDLLNRLYRHKLVRKITELCRDSKDCEVQWVEIPMEGLRPRKVPRVIFQDGWWFQLDTNFSKVEIKTAPASAAEIAVYEERLDKYIFSAAKEVGLRAPEVPRVLDSGMISLDIASAFGGDMRLLRNFLIDFANHQELATGVWHDDRFFARPLTKTPQSREALRRAIQLIDNGTLTTAADVAMVLDFHRMALQITEDGSSLDIRSIRPQTSSHEYTLLARLLEARIRYLKTLDTSLELSQEDAIDDLDSQLRSYKAYVVESGLAWADYAALLPARYKNNSCESYLQPE